MLPSAADHQRHFARLSFGDESGGQIFLAGVIGKGPNQQQQGRQHGPGGRRGQGAGGRNGGRRSKWKSGGGADGVPEATYPAHNQLLLARMRTMLGGGVPLLGRTYAFLAYSSNQLRTACAWLMAPIYCDDLPRGEGARGMLVLTA